MVYDLVWMAIATLSGLMAILGSGLTMGCLLLWFVAAPRLGVDPVTHRQRCVRMTGVALAIALGGVAGWGALPFPSAVAIPEACVPCGPTAVESDLQPPDSSDYLDFGSTAPQPLRCCPVPE